jgi:hypothetical protein
LEVKFKAWLTPLIIILALGGLAIWSKKRQAEPETAQLIECKDPVTGCGFTHKGMQSQLRFSRTPKPMVPFSIDLYAPAASKVTTSFQMIGMDMGFNRYDLKPGRSGEFRAASIILPVCTQSRSDWSVFFTLDDKIYQLNFQAR